MKLYKILATSFLFILFFNQNLFSLENKIILRIDNIIITSLDIKNEKRYLSALNPNIKNLNEETIYELSKNSLIRENIKKLEIFKNTKKIKLDEEYLNKIIESRYRSLGLSTLKEFKKYLNENNIKIETVNKKITIEAVWNQLIYKKFFIKVKIDKNNLKKEILLNKTKSVAKEFLLNEIIFNVENEPNLEKKYKKIQKSIDEIGFENTASIYSISDTAKIGGKLGWIEENVLNSKIKNKILKLKPKEYTQPISLPGGFLIIQLKKIKEIQKKVNIEQELVKKINSETNKQLNQFSNIFFNKVKKEININES
jgi:peptidyl-prolyl cis-trans isomerase SurA